MPVPGVSTMEAPSFIDAEWNVGLSGEAEEWPRQLDPLGAELDQERRAAKCSTTTKGTVRICYYCASLKPAVRASHRMAECPKRLRANQPEYAAADLAAVLAGLGAIRQRYEGRLAKLAHAAGGSRSAGKQELMQLAGAAKLLSVEGARGTPPPPPPPPPPPASERLRAWNEMARRRDHISRIVVNQMARSTRHVVGGLGELKAIALMSPHPKVLSRSVDERDVIRCASALEVRRPHMTPARPHADPRPYLHPTPTPTTPQDPLLLPPPTTRQPPTPDQPHPPTPPPKTSSSSPPPTPRRSSTCLRMGRITRCSL